MSSLVLGKPIAEQIATYPGVDGIGVDGQVLSLGSRNFSPSPYLQGQPHQGHANGTWFAANCPMAVPFAISSPVIVYQLGCVNGSSVAGNWDIGIYDTSWVRLVSTGSTAASGTGFQAQYVNVTDTPLKPGSYWAVKAMDSITANRGCVYSMTLTTPMMALLGIQDSATTAFPLPDPLTNMAQAATAVQLPSILIATRALI